jgi:hypothetical protein
MDKLLGGTLEEAVSALAKALYFVCLDRVACRRFELHHVMAITKEDAGHRDRSPSVCCRSTILLIAAPIMHVPAHWLN